MKVLKYRNDVYNETIGITPSIPIEILIRQTEHLRQNTKIMYDETNGRHLVLEKGMMKGDILGYYYGLLHKGEGADDKNEYNLKLEHLEERGGAFIDGKPKEDIENYRLSLINGDYTDTMTMHNCSIDDYGRIVMTKNTGKGRKLLMHYGLDDKGNSSYNWEKLDLFLVKTACDKIMRLQNTLSTLEISQIKAAKECDDDVLKKIRSMVLGEMKPRARHTKPSNQNIYETLDFLYSMGIFRDWITKQRSEEGIVRQNALSEKDIEAEINLLKGTRYSMRLQPNAKENDIEPEPEEEKSLDHINI
jgi:hypothetical protein